MRRISFDNPCCSCTHYQSDVCVLGNDKSVCSSFSNEEQHQLSAKEIPLMRNSILKNIQNNVCPVCNREISESEAVLDHHHVKKVKGTGLIRGVLCRTCNVFIAKSENNSVRYRIPVEELPAVLRRMADYLEGVQYPHIHPSEKAPPKYVKKDSYNKLTKAYRSGVLKKQPPPFPINGKMKLTVSLQRLFSRIGVEPEFYK